MEVGACLEVATAARHSSYVGRGLGGHQHNPHVAEDRQLGGCACRSHLVCLLVELLRRHGNRDVVCSRQATRGPRPWLHAGMQEPTHAVYDITGVL